MTSKAMKAMKWMASGALAMSFGGCIGEPQQEEVSSASLVLLPAGERAIEEYARTLMSNPDVTCSEARTVAAALPIFDLETGKWITLAGAVAIADDTVSMPGGTASRAADGGVALGVGAVWDGTTLGYGGSLIGQYSVPMGSVLPASEEEANAMFDEAFGPNARGGASLSRRQSGDLGTRAWTATGRRSLPGPDGAEYAYSFGVVRGIGGNVKAWHTTAFGNWKTVVE